MPNLQAYLPAEVVADKVYEVTDTAYTSNTFICANVGWGHIATQKKKKKKKYTVVQVCVQGDRG